MKRVMRNDYHELKGQIHISSCNNRGMSDEEKENYEQALTLLLESDFEISLTNKNQKNMASFCIKKGIVSVQIDDELSMKCE